MKSYIYLILFLIFSFRGTFPQIPDTLWTKTYGGENSEDWGMSLVESDDHGYVIVGATLESSPEDLWIFKTDNKGNLMWSKTFGTHRFETARMIRKTIDGNYVVVGTMAVDHTYSPSNIWLLKFNTFGDTLWTKSYSSGLSIAGWALDNTMDGGYAILGWDLATNGNQNIKIIKTDSLGNTSWSKSYDHSSWDEGYFIQETSDSGYIIVGTADSDIWLLKTDYKGDTLWTKTFGGVGFEGSQCVQETSDGGFILTGYANPPVSNNPNDLLLLKTNSIGDILWTKLYGDINDEEGTFVIETSNKELLIVGNKKVNGSLDIWVLKTNALGDTLWSKIIAGTYNDVAYSITETSIGQYLILGWTGSFGFSDVWLLMLEGAPLYVGEEIKNKNFFLSDNYPNPFNPTTNIKFHIAEFGFVSLTIFDGLGNEVETLINKEMQAGNYEVEFSAIGGSASGGNAYTLPSGVYFYQLKADGFIETKKMILMK
jgi:hypothetical protein